MRKIKPLRFASLLGMLVWSSLAVQAAPDVKTLERVRPSVVKVETPVTAATGFVWQDASQVVTSLHVVDGQTKITVSYINSDGQVIASSPARVIKVHKDADLVLLSLADPHQVPPLNIDTQMPAAKQTLDALGFPLNIAAHTNTQLSVRFGGKRLRSIVSPKVLSRITDYPNINLTILNLEGNLVPGLSGAPILNDAGLVVGVVDGGLENGAVGISWGIPAAELPLLAQSTNSRLPKTKGIAELFGADLNADVEEVEIREGLRLTKLRSRSFAQLVETSDDLLGLSQLATAFAMFNPYDFEYDIYQDLDSGATIVLPQGVSITHRNGFSVAGFDDEQVQIKFRLERARNTAEAQLKSHHFEQDLTEYNPGVQVMPDPGWSYVQPMVKFGITVNRKAIYRNVPDASNTSWVPDKYYFETLAFNGTTLLSVAAVNNDNSYEANQRLLQCGFTPKIGKCPSVLEERKHWAQMVLGVQFSSFPAQLRD